MMRTSGGYPDSNIAATTAANAARLIARLRSSTTSAVKKRNGISAAMSACGQFVHATTKPLVQ